MVALNSDTEPIDLVVRIPGALNGRLVDMLNDGESFEVTDGASEISLRPSWARILKVSKS